MSFKIHCGYVQKLQYRYQWAPVILTTQETEIRRIEVQSQPRQIVQETLARKYQLQKRGGGVAEGVGPEFKLQYHKKRKNKLQHRYNLYS
jgi:predicted P-loop ATPase